VVRPVGEEVGLMAQQVLAGFCAETSTVKQAKAGPSSSAVEALHIKERQQQQQQQHHHHHHHHQQQQGQEHRPRTELHQTEQTQQKLRQQSVRHWDASALVQAGLHQKEQTQQESQQQSVQHWNASALVQGICARSTQYGRGLSVASNPHKTGPDDECEKEQEQEQEVRRRL